MFCGKCGTKVNDGINFCPSCGNALKKEKKTGTVVGISDFFRKLSKKYIIIGIFIIGVTVFAFNYKKTVNKACVWCGDKPSVEYKTSNGGKSYVCKDCSKRCMLCSKRPAKHHYTNMLEAEVFVCNKCYKQVEE